MIRDPRAAQPRLRPVTQRSRWAEMAYLLGFAATLAALMALAVLACAAHRTS